MPKKRAQPEYRAPLRKSATQTWRPGGINGEGTAHRPDIEAQHHEAELRRRERGEELRAEHSLKGEAEGFGRLTPHAETFSAGGGQDESARKSHDGVRSTMTVLRGNEGTESTHKSGERAYRAGDVVRLKAVREDTELGVFLDAGTGKTDDDILLHKLQMKAPVKVGDEVEVYLYLDPHRRLTASMKLPQLREGELGYAKVLSVKRIGGFVDIGGERGVFLPYTEMRGHVSPGQNVWVKLYRDKTGRQAVTMRVDKDMAHLAQPVTEKIKRGDRVTGTIYNITGEGFFLITNERNIGFLHRSEAPAKRRLDFGEELTCRVIFVREDGRLNLSMREQKEDALLLDSELLLRTMAARDGRMPYGDATPKEILQEKFGLSKAAFKRAMGRLLKHGWAEQSEGWTVLTRNGEAQLERLAQEDAERAQAEAQNREQETPAENEKEK